jgi:hypothetical protein
MALDQAKLARGPLRDHPGPGPRVGPGQRREAAGYTRRAPRGVSRHARARRAGSFAVAVAPSTYFRVSADAAFRDEVEALLGPGSWCWRAGTAMAADPISKPLVDLQKRIDALVPQGRRRQRGRGRRRLRQQLEPRAPQRLRGAHAVAEDAGGAPSQPPYTWTSSSACSPSSRSSTGTGATATTRRSSAGRPLQGPPVAASSATRRAATPSRRSTATSACPSPRATARPPRDGAGGQVLRPIVTFVDTPGAYPARRRGARPGRGHRLTTCAHGPAARAHRGQRDGRGGSGGALAVAVGDRVNMLEHAIYSVISPRAARPSCGATRRGPRRRPSP